MKQVDLIDVVDHFEGVGLENDNENYASFHMEGDKIKLYVEGGFGVAVFLLDNVDAVRVGEVTADVE